MAFSRTGLPMRPERAFHNAPPPRDRTEFAPVRAWRACRGSVLVLAAVFLSAPSLAARAESVEATIAGDVRVTVRGCTAECLLRTSDGVLVSIGDDRVVVREDMLAINGTEHPERGFGEIVVDAAGWGMTLAIDGRTIVARSELDGLRSAAEKGNSLALNDLALRLATGVGMPRDVPRAADLYRRAATGGSAMAARNLGLLLWNGDGLPKDRAEAVRWFREAAEAGDPTSRRMLAAALTRGLGTATNEAEARRWLEAAARDGDAEAMNDLANLLKRAPAPDLRRAARLHRAAAEKGLAVAAANYGFDLWNGDGVERDRSEALGFFERAARGGSVPAMAMLGRAHRGEGGAPADPALAAHWLAKAATAGDGDAANTLGAMHLAGEVAPRDEALRWFSLGAERGHAAATRNLALLYRQGVGVARDTERARELLTLAAARGSRMAAADLAAIDAGDGVPPRIAASAGR